MPIVPLEERPKISAERMPPALPAVAVPGTQALRDGERRAISARNVVPGDVLLVREGDVVATHATELATAGVAIYESPHIGESLSAE